jgi:hypothetical protein
LFGEIPKLLDKNFLIGHFLPAGLLVFAYLGFVARFDLSAIAHDNILLGAYGFGLPLATAVILAAFNRPIFQFFEGYFRLNPFKLLRGIQCWRYNSLQREANEILQNRDTASPVERERMRVRFNDIRVKLAQEFPLQKENNKVLPWRELELMATSLGNVLNSFEGYPRVMYGFDTVEGWPRLLTSIPADFRDFIDSAQTETTFWLNLWLAAILVIVSYFASVVAKIAAKLVFNIEILRSIMQVGPGAFAAFVGLILVALWFAHSAKVSAIEWGSLVKSACDVYLPDLYQRMGFAPAATDAELKSNWVRFSQAVIYRRPEQMPPRFAVQTSQELDALEKLASWIYRN